MLKCLIWFWENGNYYRFMKKNNKYVMELIMIYENNGGNEKKVYRLLSCVVYSLIYCYVCIDYISCH